MTIDFALPSAGPEPLPWDTALAAVLGHARQPRTGDPLGEPDILIAEGLHGRLDPTAWVAMTHVLDDVRPLADAAVDRAADRPFWELPDDEFPDAKPKHVAEAGRRSPAPPPPPRPVLLGPPAAR